MAKGHEDFDRGISIDAQEISEVAVDIATQSLTQMNVDVVAQTIADLAIDIDAQTIGEVIQRPKKGSFNGTLAIATTVAAGTTKEVYNISGKGAIMSVFYSVEANTDSQLVEIHHDIDGQNFTYGHSFADMDDAGLTAESRPIRLVKYGLDSECAAMSILNGTTFETSTSLTFDNPTGNDQVVNYAVAQQLL